MKIIETAHGYKGAVIELEHSSGVTKYFGVVVDGNGDIDRFLAKTENGVLYWSRAVNAVIFDSYEAAEQALTKDIQTMN